MRLPTGLQKRKGSPRRRRLNQLTYLNNYKMKDYKQEAKMKKSSPKKASIIQKAQKIKK